MKAFSVGFPGRLNPQGPRSEFKHDALLVGQQIEVARDDLGALIDPDRLRIAVLPAYAFQGQNHVLAAVTEAWIYRRRKPREGIHDRQDAQLSPRRQLVVNDPKGRAAKSMAQT